MLHLLPLTRSILDPIHGLVRLTREEMRLIDAPLYQRLRYIKQNGVLHLVFPSATHTRFEHGIGTVFVVNAMLESLIYNSEASAAKLYTLREASPGRALQFSKLRRETLRDIFRVARIAALLHDIGHGPLSHSFDPFAPRRADVRRLFETSSVLAPLREFAELLVNPSSETPEDSAGDPEASTDHEAISCLFACKVLHEVASGEDPPAPETARAVAAALVGGAVLERVASTHALGGWLHLIHDLVASAPIDADRMDFVERDSRSCGVSYGLFDRNRLQKSMLCYRAGTRERPAYRLGWKQSGLRAIENFIAARFQLYVQIYFHKTNAAINLMLKDIGELARGSASPLFTARDTRALESLCRRYRELTDERFVAELEGAPYGSFHEARAVNELARAIRARRFYKRVYEGDAEVVRRAVEAQLEPPRGCGPLKQNTIPLGATKGLDDGAKLLRLNTHNKYALVGHAGADSWLSASPLIEMLRSRERDLSRIYSCHPQPEDVDEPLRELRATLEALEADVNREGQQPTTT